MTTTRSAKSHRQIPDREQNRAESEARRATRSGNARDRSGVAAVAFDPLHGLLAARRFVCDATADEASGSPRQRQHGLLRADPLQRHTNNRDTTVPASKPSRVQTKNNEPAAKGCVGWPDRAVATAAAAAATEGSASAATASRAAGASSAASPAVAAAAAASQPAPSRARSPAHTMTHTQRTPVSGNACERIEQQRCSSHEQLRAASRGGSIKCRAS